MAYEPKKHQFEDEQHQIEDEQHQIEDEQHQIEDEKPLMYCKKWWYRDLIRVSSFVLTV